MILQLHNLIDLRYIEVMYIITVFL